MKKLHNKKDSCIRSLLRRHFEDLMDIMTPQQHDWLGGSLWLQAGHYEVRLQLYCNGSFNRPVNSRLFHDSWMMPLKKECRFVDLSDHGKLYADFMRLKKKFLAYPDTMEKFIKAGFEGKVTQ